MISVRPSLVWCSLVWSACAAFCAYFEVQRLLDCMASPTGVLGWLANWNIDTTLPLLMLLTLPLLMLVAWQMGWNRTRRVRQRVIASSDDLSSSAEPTKAAASAGKKSIRVACVFLFAVSIGCSLAIGMRPIVISDSDNSTVPFYRLPPAYHDEFSYRLQAQTFLAGRLAWPGMTALPELFHQVHVVNQPTTASRYFPWTGFWMAPFEAFDVPIYGHWLAGGIACVFFYLSLRLIVIPEAAFFGGLLIALSPGLAVFSNLLLAHHPTMMALSIFLWAFLNVMQEGNLRYAFLAGTMLTLAMLGRPMTAAGFALPFGCWLLMRLLFWWQGNSLEVLKIIPRMGLPLLVGFGILAVMNQAVTGSWKKSAYQHYTETWTPRHGYGFNNVQRAGESTAGSGVMSAYDRWAVNLTPPVALKNLENRLIASSQWSLGIIALGFGLCMSLPLLWGYFAQTEIRLLWLAVICLHAVHIPYWFDGILHWHYVFETAPLMLMLTAVGCGYAAEALRTVMGRRTAWFWLACLCAGALVPNWINANTLWGPSRVSLAVGEQAFSRIRMEQFRRMTHDPSVLHPALILVDESGTDPQLSYIVNPPNLQGDVLVCRKPALESDLQLLQQAFPDRTLYNFQPTTFLLKKLSEKE